MEMQLGYKTDTRELSLNYVDPTFKRKRGILKKRLTNLEMNA